MSAEKMAPPTHDRIRGCLLLHPHPEQAAILRYVAEQEALTAEVARLRERLALHEVPHVVIAGEVKSGLAAFLLECDKERFRVGAEGAAEPGTGVRLRHIATGAVVTVVSYSHVGGYRAYQMNLRAAAERLNALLATTGAPDER